MVRARQDVPPSEGDRRARAAHLVQQGDAFGGRFTPHCWQYRTPVRPGQAARTSVSQAHAPPKPPRTRLRTMPRRTSTSLPSCFRRSTGCAAPRSRPFCSSRRPLDGRVPRRRPLLRPVGVPDHSLLAGRGGPLGTSTWLGSGPAWARRLLPALALLLGAESRCTRRSSRSRTSCRTSGADGLATTFYFANWHDVFSRPELLGPVRATVTLGRTRGAWRSRSSFTSCAARVRRIVAWRAAGATPPPRFFAVSTVLALAFPHRMVVPLPNRRHQPATFGPTTRAGVRSSSVLHSRRVLYVGGRPTTSRGWNALRVALLRSRGRPGVGLDALDGSRAPCTKAASSCVRWPRP